MNDFTMRTKVLRTALLCGTLSVTLVATSAHAQDAAPTAAPAAVETYDDGNTIVVTSRKREERLQDVPLAITAISGEEMRSKGISSLSDLAALTPGLAYQDLNGAYAAPVLRGVAQIDQTGPQGNVGIFIDGVYLNNRSALAFDQYDLERVEVVKGPQSATYGRNTFAGAINYITAAPKVGEFSGRAVLTLGNYDRREVKGSINIPVMNGVAVRVFGGFSEFGGTIKNQRNGKHLDGWNDRWSIGGALTAEITDNLTLDLFGVRSETANKHPSLYALPTSLNNCGASTTVGGQDLNTFYCGKLPYPTNINLDDETGYGLTGSNEIYYGKLNYEGEAVDLTAVLSYTAAEFGLLIDTTGDPAAVNTPNFGDLSRQLFTNAATDSSTDWNFDFRAASKAGSRLSWMLGYNVYKSAVSDILELNFQTVGTEPGTTPPPAFSTRGGELKTTGHAIYGMVGYELSDKLNVQGELRYTIDDQEFTGFGSANAAQGKQSFKYLTPRFSVNWKPNRDVLVYATAARGVKTGAFNANAFDTDFFRYGSESNWTYEAGVKTSWLGGKLVANAGVFYVDWQDINAQKQMPFSTLAVIGNNGDAEVKGIEAQIAYKATRNLSFNASGALMDPKYKKGVFDGEVAYICGEIAGSTATNANCTANVGGNQIARTSNKQFSVGSSWDIPEILTNVDGYLRADYSWQSSKYSTGMNLQEQGAISLLNARAGIKYGNFELAIWAKNLMDRKYVSRSSVVASTVDGGPLSGVSYTRVYPGERRTIGADLSVKF